ncbi:DNA repair protein RadC [Paenibacillus sp. JGP012]|uniref:JAB domain-containing protein n=1 Tax=Paenibacillus sp. JGP012 TaxID=2735914 RepID=UPI0016207903|nr:DNA repair protein RadC [Paenibacillus sp. JGP012]MBB6021417.1 DNA repair protein RadC [Paenibacillus sp. JGP012]
MKNFSVNETQLASLPRRRREHAEKLLHLIERVLQEDVPSEIRRPEDVYQLVAAEMSSLPNEHFVAIMLNVKNRVISKETIGIGTLNGAIVHPRELFRRAILKNAASIICVHNHPSGDPTPSQEDIKVTKRLYDAGEIVDINVLDHIIVGVEGFVSLKQLGMM